MSSRPAGSLPGCRRPVGYNDGMEHKMTADNLLTRKEAAARLRVSLTTMSMLTQSGQVYSFKLDRKVLIPAEALDAYVNGIRVSPPANPIEQPNVNTWPPTGSLFEDPEDTTIETGSTT